MNDNLNKIDFTTNLNSSLNLQLIKEEGGSDEEISQLFNESVKSETPKLTEETLLDQKIVEVNSQGEMENDKAEKEFNGDILPHEIISLIFSFVDKDIDPVRFCINKDWRKWVINDFKQDLEKNFLKIGDAIIEILQKKDPDFEENIDKVNKWKETVSIEGDDRITIDANVRAIEMNLLKTSKIESVVELLLSLGEVDEALETANLIRHHTIPSFQIFLNCWRDALEKIINYLLEEKKIEKSLLILEEIPETEIHPSTLKHIIEKLIDIGKIDEALKLAEKITDKEVQSRSLKKIALSTLQREGVEPAIEIIKKICYIDCRLEPLNEVAKILVAQNHTDQALEVSKLATEYFISHIHLAIVEELLIKGKTSDAKKIAGEIEDKNFRSLALRKIKQHEETASNIDEEDEIMGIPEEYIYYKF